MLFVAFTRELSASILLYSPKLEVLSVVIYDMYQEGGFRALSALTMLQIVIAMLVAARHLRHRAEVLYPTVLWLRALFCAGWLGLWFYSHDPMFLVLLGLVGFDHISTRQPGSTSTCRRRSRGFVFGALMVFWALSRPTVPTPEASRGEGSTVRGAPAM